MRDPSANDSNTLSAFDLACVVAGGIVGVGIFFTPSKIAASVGSSGQMIAAWVLGGVLAFLGALVFAELSARVPGHGGIFRYVHRAFGRAPAFLYGWANWLVIQAGALGIVAIFMIENAVQVIAPGHELADGVVTALAAFSILIFTLLNIAGLRFGKGFQNLLVLTKFAAVFVLVVMAIVVGLDGAESDAAATVSEAPPREVPFWKAMAAAILPIMFSFSGWQQGVSLAGSARSAGKVSAGLLIGVGAVVIAYLAINLAFLELLGFEGTADAKRTVGTAAAAAALEPFGFGDLAGRVFAAAVVLSAIGIMNTFCLAPPFVLSAMAREGLFFRIAGRIDPRRGTPAAAVVAQGGWAILLLVIARQAGFSLFDLVDGVVFVDWLGFALCGLTLLRLRSHGEGDSGFRIPAGKVVTVVFVGCAFLVMAGAIATNPLPSLYGLTAVLLGVPFAVGLRRAK